MISFVRYLTRPVLYREQQYWSSHKLVKALKGEPVNGYADYEIDGIRGRIEQENAGTVPVLFGRLVEQLAKHEGQGLCFVPVPDHTCSLRSNEPPHNVALIKEALRQLPRAQMWDGLRWANMIPRASTSNIRVPTFYYDRLRLISPKPERKSLILVDDVFTSGAHFKAARARLSEKGPDCKLAICFARTVHDQELPALGREVEELEPWTPEGTDDE